MTQSYFPLRWESTGDQWWYASPLDWAAANGHYDLVRQLLRIDNNHLINLTSLRRIRRLETVWDDEEQFHDVAKSRSNVAKKLFYECECTKGKNSLLQAGYGGWLLYTAASAGDLSFVQELLKRNSLLVYGEGEYGITDVFYAGSRGNNSAVFWFIYDFAVCPRVTDSKSGELVEQMSEIPPAFKWEMMNRAAHAAARGGNSSVLKELLANCTDILALRDKHGSTILHAAAARGKVKVISYLVSTIDIINSKDNLGNTALHVAAYRGQLSAVEALMAESPTLIASQNNIGDTFLHTAISGFTTPTFKRLDRQISMMKKLLCSENFNLEKIINAKNKDGRSPLHMAIIANVHIEVVQLLMSTPSINVNSRDSDGMTPLDLLKQKPRTVSSELLIKQLISAGGIFSIRNYTARRAIASQLKLEGGRGSPGALFRVSDAEIFQGTGIQFSLDSRAEADEVDVEDEKGLPPSEPIFEQNLGHGKTEVIASPTNHCDRADSNNAYLDNHKRKTANSAAQRLKWILQWLLAKEKVASRAKESRDRLRTKSMKKYRGPQVTPAPLRLRFAKPSSSPSTSNKRTLSARSNQSSPAANKKVASGLAHGAMQRALQANLRGRSRSASLSRLSFSSSGSVDQQTVSPIRDHHPVSSCDVEAQTEREPCRVHNVRPKHKRSRSHYLCFGASGWAVETPVIRHRRNRSAVASIRTTGRLIY